MININKNTTNYLYLTLTEKCNLPTPYFLMKLVSKDTLSEKVLRFGNDISSNYQRFNKFVLEEVPLAQEDLNIAKINLTSINYDYFVYETESSTGTTITGLNMIEKGMLTVSGTSSNTITNFNNNKTIISFK